MRIQALEGLRVVDFTWVGVGPTVTKYLADFGAEVIRIESRTRLDPFRYAPPFVEDQSGIERSGQFLQVNTSKCHVTLNLNHPKARELARRLIAQADVVAENFSSRVMERWHLTYADLREVKPDLIMISLSMEGRTGPHRDALGFGTVLQAAAGLSYLTGWPDRSPSIPGVPYTDWTTPFFGLVALLAALEYRRRTGTGQYIDVSNLEAGVNCLETAILDYTVNGREQVRAGNELLRGDLPETAPHGVYRCLGEDRWCAIAVFTDREWARLCEVLGSPAWAREPRFATVLGRVRHRDALQGLLESWTSQLPAEEVMHRLQAGGIAAGIVQHAADVSSDPQLAHRSHWSVLDHPEVGPQRYDGPGFHLSTTPARPRPVPRLGQHNAYVFNGLLGLTDQEYAALEAEGIFE
ncbi:MAG: CoA transferase [Nitrospinae bacterium]|nr:CoA transferase [Nitrospinota bacterium]